MNQVILEITFIAIASFECQDAVAIALSVLELAFVDVGCQEDFFAATVFLVVLPVAFVGGKEFPYLLEFGLRPEKNPRKTEILESPR